VRQAGYASLLDDPGFLAQLDQLEVSDPPAVEHPIATWFVETESDRNPLRPERTIGDIALGVVGFLMMMGLGGAAAAYVFADRVALILAR
jgi:hypothetical protein